MFKNLLKLSCYKNEVSKQFFSLYSSGIIKINMKKKQKTLSKLTFVKAIKEVGEYSAKVTALKQNADKPSGAGMASL